MDVKQRYFTTCFMILAIGSSFFTAPQTTGDISSNNQLEAGSGSISEPNSMASEVIVPLLPSIESLTPGLIEGLSEVRREAKIFSTSP